MGWLVLFVALLNDLPGFVALSVPVLVLIYGARLWSRLGPKKLRWDLEADRIRVFPGERVTLKIDVENGKALPVLVKVAVSSGNGLFSADDGSPLSREVRLLWYQRIRMRWRFTAQKRGWHCLGSSRISCGDLLGFFQRETRKAPGLYITVFPRLVPLKPPLLLEKELFGAPGARLPVEDPVYFIGARDYQNCRPARHIFWKASARYCRLQEKVFQPSARKKVFIVVEVDQFEENGAADVFERMLEAVGSLAAYFHGESCPVGMATNGIMAGGGRSVFPVSRKPEQVTHILEALARVRMNRQGSISELLRNILLPWGTGCIHAVFRKEKSPRGPADFFALRKAPVITLVCDGEGSTARGEPKTYRLDEILALERPEGGGP
jgi:uncharacterized protein (DUF58 family)